MLPTTCFLSWLVLKLNAERTVQRHQNMITFYKHCCCTSANHTTKARYAVLLTTQQTSCATYVHIVVHLFNDTAITLFWFVSFLTRSAGNVTPNSREFFRQIFSYNHKRILAVVSAVINGLVNGAICGQ